MIIFDFMLLECMHTYDISKYSAGFWMEYMEYSSPPWPLKKKKLMEALYPPTFVQW